MKEIMSLLNKIGLTQKQATIYLFLLSHSPTSISNISRGTGLYRPDIYKELKVLLDKTVVTESPKGKQVWYQAEAPSRLREIIKDTLIDLEESLPALEEMYSHMSPRSVIRSVEGKNGIRSIFSDLVTTLKRGETFYRYTSSKDLKVANMYLPKDYRKLRDAKDIQRLVIGTAVNQATKIDRLEKETKYIPVNFDTFNQNIIQLMYSNKVAFINLNNETGLIIDNPELADFHKKIFKLLYTKL